MIFTSMIFPPFDLRARERLQGDLDLAWGEWVQNIRNE